MQEIFSWLESRQEEMVDLAQRWSDVNTFSTHLEGLALFSRELTQAFAVFDTPVQSHSFPPFQTISTTGQVHHQTAAPALSWRLRPDAPHQILLVGHMDTVHPPGGGFLTCTPREDGTIRGPGITDMKGGLVVMLYVLQALERCPWGEKVGWQVIINTDEELGSPASGELLTEVASGFDLGLVFEPSLSNGDLVSARKGSGNYTVVIRGKSAHAGRNPQDGRSAIDAAAAWIMEVKSFFREQEELTINMGEISGGTARNVVADLAVVRFNVRCHAGDVQKYFEEQMPLLNHRVAAEHLVSIQQYEEAVAPPKPLTDEVRALFELLKRCGADLGMDVHWQSTGGVCDGNRLAAGGLPTIDTLGVRGGLIHSPEEYVDVQSFTQRAKLVLSFIAGWVRQREEQREHITG